MAADGRILSTSVISTLALAEAPRTGAAAVPSNAGRSGNSPIESLRSEADGDVAIRSDSATTGTSLVRVERDGDLYPQGRNLPPVDKAAAFLARNGAVFGIEDMENELRLTEISEDQYGNTRLAYQQMHGDVPVFGALMFGHVSQDGRLTAVNGKFVPDVDLPAKPAIPKADALQTAVSAVGAQQPATRKSIDLQVSSASLVVYRTFLARGTPGQNHLAYEVQVTHDTTVREFVYVDAFNGKIVDQITGIHGLKHRRVHEGSPNPPPAWEEGDARPAPDPAHEDEITGAGYAYNLFFNLSGGTYRSWDGADAEMVTVNNDPTIVCPNANWNGATTNYCSFVSADDVVVHEWTHAYTQETSGLIYQWQSGALNESYSDIFGETVDQINNREQIGLTTTTGNDGPRSSDDAVCSSFTSETPTSDDSIRWLMGEDALAFSPLPPVGDAAIRDMWHPNCAGGDLFFGDPGHVNSPRYSCSSGDGGGVHTNSAVNNRAYALLADGDTVTLKDDATPFANPVTVTGIGLTKAAHIFWRANSVYNGPATNFAENADSLEMACQDLINVNLTKLVTTGEDGTYPHLPTAYNDDTIDPTPELSGEVITAADCDQVANAIAAVEMRHDVTKQCGFGPMFDPAPAPRCGNAQVNTYFSENWENGFPGDWSTGQTPATKSMLDTAEWFLRSGDLPDNRDGSPHAGSAIFQENRHDLGNCTTDDESGVLFLDSPEITVDANNASQLVLNHYVNTELGYDGGNLMISINGGAFSIIPASAFVHNGYPGNLNDVVDQNTNPKGGQPAFHGGNENEVFGDWGESQLDLALAGVQPGDTIVLRWDFGQDGCNGNEGWFVDEVELFTCGAVVEPPTEQCISYPASGFLPVVGSPISNLAPSVTTAAVSGETAAVSDANIRNMKGSHSFIGDLNFQLQSPAGTTITLFDGAACEAEEGIDVEFDDDAATVISCNDWLSGDEFRPHQALGTFGGENANGNWTLTVTDGFFLDEGQLDSWELELCTPIEPEPEGDGDKTTGGGWLGDVGGGKINFGFNAKQKSDGPQGNLQLNDKDAGVKIHLKDVSEIGAIQGMCGAITEGANALEFRGSGTFNKTNGASFRVCVEDNGEPGNSNSSPTPDRFYLECVAGCSYDTGTRALDDALDGGNIQVHRTDSGSSGGASSSAGEADASTLILNPVLLTEGAIGAVQLIQVDVFGPEQEPLSGRTVNLTRVGANGSVETLSTIAGPTGSALFSVTILGQQSEYRATADNVDSNTVDVTPVLP